jgi:hypothetical protein
MQNKNLEKRLRKELESEQVWQAVNLREAEEARQQGDMLAYFSQMRSQGLADVYWYLEIEDMAREYFLLDAEVYKNKRDWAEQHAYPGYPIDALIDWETAAYIKAGMLDRGREFLQRWYAIGMQDRARAFHMHQLSLYAAQVGDRTLAESMKYHVDNQLSMFDRVAPEKQRAVTLFHHHDYAMVNFLLGRYDQARQDVEMVSEAEAVMEERSYKFYTITEQKIGIEKAMGLKAILDLRDGIGDREDLYKQAVSHLEQSMLHSIKTVGLLVEGYHLRLCTRMAKDILEGREPQANPFAVESDDQ